MIFQNFLALSITLGQIFPIMRLHPIYIFQEVFAHFGFSGIKTMVMMLGEIDYGDMVAQHVTNTGIEPTFHMPFPAFTTIYFVVFIFLISILIMNLLVGVSIDDISGMQMNCKKSHKNNSNKKSVPQFGFACSVRFCGIFFCYLFRQ